MKPARPRQELLQLLRFELRYLARDPVALLLTLLLPVLLYPLMMSGFSKASRSDRETTESAELVVVAPGAVGERLAAVAEDERLILRTEGDAAALEGEDAAHVVIELDEQERPAALHYRSTSWKSREARTRVERVLSDWQDEERAAAWAEAGMPVAPDEVLVVDVEDGAGDAVRQALRLGQLLPGMLVFLVMSSGLYVALDLFAGEKERGTLETLLTSRVDRRSVLGAKTIVVILVSLASVASSLLALWLTMASGIVDMEAVGGAATGLQPGALLRAGLLLVPLSVVLSAILVVGAAWARDYRQGQALGLPLLMLGVVPAGVAAVPDLALGPLLALVPISGVALALRDAMAGELSLLHGGLALGGAVVHAGLGLVVAGRLIGREDVLLGGGAVRRDPERRGREAAVVFVVAMLLFWFLGQLAQARDVLWGLVFSQVLIIGGVALAAVFVLNQKLRSLWRLHRPRGRDLLLGLVAGVGCTGMGQLIQDLQAPVLPMSTRFSEQFAEMLDLGIPLWGYVLLVAVQPAIFEEVLFRGTLLGLLRRTGGPWTQALLVGLMFGVFHLSVFRILPTGVLGVVLTLACLRSGSIFVPMLMHFLNNALLVVGSSEELGLVDAEAGPPLWWAVLGTLLVAGSLALMGRGRTPAAAQA